MVQLFSDGGSRGNPGIAGAGFVLFDENRNEIFAGKQFLGIQTNNFAEYTALFLGIEKARELGIQKLSCFLDSELVVKQLNGIYRMKNPDLKVIFDKIMMQKKDFEFISFAHVYREKNKRADALANESMDTRK